MLFSSENTLLMMYIYLFFIPLKFWPNNTELHSISRLNTYQQEKFN